MGTLQYATRSLLARSAVSHRVTTEEQYHGCAEQYHVQ